jgi:alpha-D-xyloside xylohydrolase
VKFRDGYWGIREGFRHLGCGELWETEAGERSLTVYTAVKPVRSRGDTLNAPLLTTVFSSPLPGVIRVRCWHHQGGLARGPAFELLPDGGEGVRAEDGQGAAVFSAGALSLRIEKQGPWRAAFLREGRELTAALGKLSGHFTGPGGEVFMAQYLSLGVGETVYGLGERFGPLVKNGQTVDIWNEDGGTSSEQAYKNVPFYISSRGYGVLVNNPGRVSFEAASEVVTAVQFSVPGELLDYYLISGDSLKEVLRNYTALSGRPALPPAWSFGLWLTTSFTTGYDEKTVSSFIDGMAERNIPLHVFHFDCFWMKGFRWVDFEWDRDQFPDPPAMLGRLKARGLKICLWINPYIAQRSPLFHEGMEKGYLVKRPGGSVWQWDRWQAGMALVDFTNPGAVAWYRDRLNRLLDMGVDTFKTDFGERIPTEVEYHNGADPAGMHNYYTYLYNQTVFELLREKRGPGEALVFARSATAGSQKFPVHWGGDCSASYESMAETLRGGLSLALSGFGFWSHDIGGFESTATADLFKRWTAFGLLSSHSRLHGNESYRVPWNFDEEACEVLRFFTGLKCRLMPYIFGQARIAHREGLPLTRAMVLEFPDDPACPYLDRQYLLGDSLLAAPVFSETGEVSYYLPEGRWFNLLTGEAVSGGRWRRERHGYLSLPLMVRPGAVIPLGSNSQRPDYDYARGVSLQVFALEDGETARVSIPALGGKIETEFTLSRNGPVLRAERRGPEKPWSLLLRGLKKAGNVSGGSARQEPEGLLVSAGAETAAVELTAYGK